LRGLADSRTTVVIAQCLSVMVDADRIPMVDHGTIVERSSPIGIAGARRHQCSDLDMARASTK